MARRQDHLIRNLLVAALTLIAILTTCIALATVTR